MRESLDERDGRRAMEIISFAINLEHIGYIIDKNLMEIAAKKIKNKYQFSKEGDAELTEFHQRIREVRQGPDGLLYLLTDQKEGALLRIEPAP